MLGYNDAQNHNGVLILSMVFPLRCEPKQNCHFYLILSQTAQTPSLFVVREYFNNSDGDKEVVREYFNNTDEVGPRQDGREHAEHVEGRRFPSRRYDLRRWVWYRFSLPLAKEGGEVFELERDVVDELVARTRCCRRARC